MKTKIIYISGSEIFEMADIRAAFEEVRGTLGLDSDTVLFGVPVDNDNAIENESTNDKINAVTEPCTITETSPDQIQNISTEFEPNITDTPLAQTDNSPADTIKDVIPATDIEQAAPVKKSRGRPRKTAAITQEMSETDTTESIRAEKETNIETNIEAAADKVIPILSVLASGAPSQTSESIRENTIDEIAAEHTEAILSDEDTDAIKPESVIVTDAAADNISLDDIIDDDAPTAPVEKTLEQLLESMTPLREDHGDAVLHTSDDVSPMDIDTPDAETTNDDADATLEQLAAEFADTADEIPVAPSAPSQGKIGKLKNILPFKKARRDDTGLMGDLFGWAGVAANDEDFSIPGFFTTAASKK